MKIGSSLSTVKLFEHNCLVEVIVVFLNFSLFLFCFPLCRKELQELQNLYRQNIEHTVQQAELIKQLQALNADTQKVLKDQEDAHTAETTSYQKVCHSALRLHGWFCLEYAVHDEIVKLGLGQARISTGFLRMRFVDIL